MPGFDRRDPHPHDQVKRRGPEPVVEIRKPEQPRLDANVAVRPDTFASSIEQRALYNCSPSCIRCQRYEHSRSGWRIFPNGVHDCQPPDLTGSVRVCGLYISL